MVVVVEEEESLMPFGVTFEVVVRLELDDVTCLDDGGDCCCCC